MTSITFTQTAGELITNALRDARIIAAEQPIKAKDLKNGLQAINMVIKHWQAQGIHLWSETEAVLPLVTDQRKYLMGPDGDDIAIADTFFNTELTAALVADDTVITVTETTGTTIDGQSITMGGADDILETNPAISTQDWTTINSGTITASTDGLELTNGAALAGGAELTLETVADTDYQVDISYTLGTSSSAVFTVEDSVGVLDTDTLTATGTTTLTFTARDTETTFRFENGSSTISETSTLADVNYRDKSSGDRIGIELDDGTRFWDNIVTVDSTTQVTINNGVTSAAAIDNTVYTYETGIPRPMRVLQARFASTVTASEIPVTQWSRDEYFDQPDKGSSGTVVNWYYTPTLTIGQLYVWQVASSINSILRFTYVDSIDIPTDTIDPLDFPSEWYMPLKWAIAAELGPGYGVSENRQVILESKAAGAISDVLGFDVERDSMSIQPDFQ